MIVKSSGRFVSSSSEMPGESEVLMKIGNTQQTNSQLSQIGSLPRHIATAAAAERRAAAVLEPGPRLQNA